MNGWAHDGSCVVRPMGRFLGRFLDGVDVQWAVRVATPEKDDADKGSAVGYQRQPQISGVDSWSLDQ